MTTEKQRQAEAASWKRWQTEWGNTESGAHAFGWQAGYETGLAEAATFRRWAQRLLDVSEYIGMTRQGAEAWLCAFGCNGHSYDNLDGVEQDDGSMKYTPPPSRSWHARGCQTLALAADLATR